MGKKLDPTERMPLRLAEMLRLYMETYNISLRDISKETGLPHTIISRFTNGYTTLTLESYRRLSSWMLDYHPGAVRETNQYSRYNQG